MNLKSKALGRFKIKRLSIDIYIVLILLCVLFFFKKVLFNNQIIYGYDIVNEQYYFKTWIYNALFEGKSAFWNPHFLSGYPFLAEPENGIFYPLNFLFFILPIHLAIKYTIFIHIILGGVFMYFFMRTIIVERFSSFISAIVFIFSEFTILRIYAEGLPVVSVIIWAPLLFLCLEKALQNNNLSFFILAGLVNGMQILAGHLQFSFYIIFGASIYFIFRLSVLFNNKGNFTLIFRLVSFFLITILIGFLVSAVQMLPTLELAKLSTRKEGINFFWATLISFPPENLIKFIVPEFFGNEITTDYWGRGVFCLSSVYLGILPLTLIFMSFLNRNKFSFFFLGLGLLSLILAMGKHAPLFALFYKYVPGFNLFRTTSRVVFLTTFSGAILSGFGCSFFSGIFKFKEKRKLQKFCNYLLVFSILFFLSILIFLIITIKNLLIWENFVKYSFSLGRFFRTLDFVTPTFFYETCVNVKGNLIRFIILFGLISFLLFLFSRVKIKHALFKVIIFAVVFFDLCSFDSKYLQSYDLKNFKWEVEIAKFFKNDNDTYRITTLIPRNKAPLNQIFINSYQTGHEFNEMDINKGMINGTSNVGGEWGLILKQYAEFTGNPDTFGIYNIKNRKMINMLNVKYYMYPTSQEVIGPTLKFVFGTDKAKIYLNTEYLPRCLIIHNIKIIEKDKVLSEILKDSFNPRETIILEENPNINLDSKIAPLEDEHIKIMEYANDRIKIVADLIKDGFLLINDIYYPGWKVYVDGVERKIYRANYIFRAVYLEKGSHHVEFVFKPASFKIGLLISVSTLLTLIIFGLVKKIASKHQKWERKEGV